MHGRSLPCHPCQCVLPSAGRRRYRHRSHHTSLCRSSLPFFYTLSVLLFLDHVSLPQWSFFLCLALRDLPFQDCHARTGAYTSHASNTFFWNFDLSIRSDAQRLNRTYFNTNFASIAWFFADHNWHSYFLPELISAVQYFQITMPELPDSYRLWHITCRWRSNCHTLLSHPGNVLFCIHHSLCITRHCHFPFARIAAVGHTCVQARHPMHSSSRTFAFPSGFMTIALTGHAVMQLPQPIQTSLFIVTAMSFSSFPNDIYNCHIKLCTISIHSADAASIPDLYLCCNADHSESLCIVFNTAIGSNDQCSIL